MDIREQFAYRGYVVNHNSIRKEWYISKDGAHIASAKGEDDAKNTIDLIAD